MLGVRTAPSLAIAGGSSGQDRRRPNTLGELRVLIRMGSAHISAELATMFVFQSPQTPMGEKPWPDVEVPVSWRFCQRTCPAPFFAICEHWFVEEIRAVDILKGACPEIYFEDTAGLQSVTFLDASAHSTRVHGRGRQAIRIEFAYLTHANLTSKTLVVADRQL